MLFILQKTQKKGCDQRKKEDIKMSKMYVKIVDAEVVFSNSFGYNKKGVKRELYIHSYGIACRHETGQVSRFIVKTFGNKNEDPIAETGRRISLTGELVEEKWKDKNDKWVSRVAIIADHIEVIDDIEDDDEDEDDEKPKKKSRK